MVLSMGLMLDGDYGAAKGLGGRMGPAASQQWFQMVSVAPRMLAPW